MKTPKQLLQKKLIVYPTRSQRGYIKEILEINKEWLKQKQFPNWKSNTWSHAKKCLIDELVEELEEK